MTTPALYAATGHSAGEECSSTYEGRHVTVEESQLLHPVHGDGFVDHGDPVMIGENIVGVAFTSAAAATDEIAIDTEGIWYLSVLGCVSDGTSDGIAKALTAGCPIFINRSTGVLSGQSDPYHFAPFGYALGDVTSSTTVATLVAVKVHNSQCSDLGRLHFGSGSTAAGNMLLEGDIALRKSKMIEACAAPTTILLAGEQIHGMEIRMVDNVISTGGELTAAELKAVRDEATAATVSSATALKLDCDNKVGGVAPYVRGLDIKMEGAGTAPAIRSAIHVGSSGTVGTREALLELDSFTVCGGVASDTLSAPSGTIAVNVAGTIHYLQLYST
jgi:hypothetical protein